LNVSDIKDLFYDISINKKNKIDKKPNTSKYKGQRDLLLYLLKKNTSINLKELDELLKSYKFSISFQQIAKICAKFDGKSPLRLVKTKK